MQADSSSPTSLFRRWRAISAAHQPLKDLQQDLGLSYLMIAHDLAIVRHVSDRIAVMYLGKLMEVASWTDLYESPLHPYTTALLSAVPIPDPDIESERDRIILQGGIPSPANPPSGCVFHTRCPMAIDECRPRFGGARNHPRPLGRLHPRLAAHGSRLHARSNSV